jgi:hypothetical protein
MSEAESHVCEHRTVNVQYCTSTFDERVLSTRFDVLISVVLEIQVWWDTKDLRTKLKALRPFKNVSNYLPIDTA